MSLLVGFGVGAAVMVAEPSSGTAPPTPTHESHVLACAQADAKAVETLVHRLRGETDADLRQAADTLFRLRRARRNCRAGWVALAHADYRAIEQSAQRAASEPKPR